MPSLRRASGCLFGLACGDALGAPGEFLSVNEILMILWLLFVALQSRRVTRTRSHV